SSAARCSRECAKHRANPLLAGLPTLETSPIHPPWLAQRPPPRTAPRRSAGGRRLGSGGIQSSMAYPQRAATLAKEHKRRRRFLYERSQAAILLSLARASCGL